jgi:hypothetical protein
MYDVAVIEATQHMDDSIAFANIGKELIAQAFALAGTLYKAGNINYIAHSGNDSARMNQLGQFGESFIGHTYLPHLSIYGTKREICSLSLSAAQTIKKCRFAHVGQSYYTCFHLILYFKLPAKLPL